MRGKALPLLSAALSLQVMAAQQNRAQPQEPPPKQTFKLARASSPVRVDGVFDEPAWSSATVIPLDKEWSPGDNVVPPVETQCLVMFDADNLYVAFRARDDDPGRIRGHLADRDTPFTDDTVGFLLDPFNDERRAVQFRINPVGVQMDGTYSDVDGAEDWSWDAIWDSAGRVGKDGYTVEARVPFTSLRFPRASAGAQTWGFTASRDYPRSSRHRMRSSYTNRNKSCVVCQLDRLSGFEGIAPGLNVELDPTFTSSRTDTREVFPDGPVRHGPLHGEAGLTARWGITPNLAANAAFNPDFSQVEADAAQLAINTRFALFFPEKRPFFLEGADFFSTPLPVVFTRTVADPSAGLKLSGKEGRHAFGVFLTRDRVNNLIFPANQRSGFDSVDQQVTGGVFRYRRDVGETSTLGLLYADREADDYSNRLGGIDGNVRLGDKDTIRFQVLRSSSRYPPAVALDNGQSGEAIGGAAYSVNYGHDGRDWAWSAEYSDLDPDFRADGGFIPRVDTKTGNAEIVRTFWGKPASWFDRIDLAFAANRTEDHAGVATDQGGDLALTYAGPRQTSVEVNLTPVKEFFEGVTYDNFRQKVFLSMKPTSDFSFSVTGRFGETIDFENSRQADLTMLAPGIEFNLGRHVHGKLDHTAERLTVSGGRLFTAKLTQAHLLYHLNLRAFFRAILQYETLDRNVNLYLDPKPDPKTRTLFTQLLFSYKINPQTVFLLGYSDDYLGLEQAGVAPIGLTQTDRTFFFKLGYAWVL